MSVCVFPGVHYQHGLVQSRPHIAMTASILDFIVMFETATAFLMQDDAKQSFHQPMLWYIYVDLGVDSTTTFLSLPLNLAE